MIHPWNTRGIDRKTEAGGEQDMPDKKYHKTDGAAKRGKAEEEEIIEGEIIEEGVDAGTSPVSDSPASAEGISVDEYNALAEELQQVQEKAKEYFDGWQRERADFANYKRRVERDQVTMTQNIKGDVAKKYLGVLDDLERAMKNRPSTAEAEAWASGIELIVRKIQGILEAEGVYRIPAEEEEFNPNRHEAITYEKSPDHKGGEIIEVVQQGYTLGERVLRPAMVRVARD
jgi:molecular chaperone GrpE